MSRPLDGIRVIDAGRAGTAPWTAMILADLGADVIKLEPPEGDFARRAGTPGRNGVESFFVAANRGKRSIALDLRTAAGVEAALRVAATADVFVHNFRPGVAEEIGLGYEAVSARRHDVVYCAISGFGPDGPYSRRPAFDPIIQALIGVGSLQRAHPDEPPALVRQMFVDKVTAWTAAQAVLAALLVRAGTGTGQKIEVPMLDSALYFMWPDTMLEHSFVGPMERGALNLDAVQLTRTADGHVAQLAVSLPQRHAVLRAIGRPELCADPRFATARSIARAENLDAWRAEVEATARTMDSATLLKLLEAEGVPCGPVREPGDLLSDEHVREAGLVVEWEDREAGRVRTPRFGARFSATPIDPAVGSPVLGGDGPAILAEAGWDPSGIAALIDDSTVIVPTGTPGTGTHSPAGEQR